ncbi:MAG TPA: hypothetical protein PLB92_10790, partial [Rhodoglobus sp.]|nr:hypothetical protein [Rhodoglobus sp.]
GRYQRSYLNKPGIEKVRLRQKAWKESRRVADSLQTGSTMNGRGHILRTSTASTNAAMRILMNLRLANGMFHPWLFISAPLETGVRNVFEGSVTMLTGENFSTIGLAKKRIEDKFNASAFAKSVLGRTITGNAEPEFSLETLIHAQDTSVSLSHMPDGIAMIHSDLYAKREMMGGHLERFTERMVNVFGKWQDPSYGITPRASADRIVGAVLRYFSEIGEENGRGVDEALTLLSRSPQQFRKEHPVAYQLALNSLANARTIKATSFSLFARSVIDPLSSHTNPILNISSNLMLKIPFAFQNYAFNLATNMLGLQGLDAMLALALQGKSGGKSWGRTQAWLSGNSAGYNPELHGTDYLGNVLENINFADAFIRSGMTHTGLMGLGLVLGSLTGGDDEEKKRRRREQMLGVGHVYDPRDFENDWRNADAIYLDGIPLLGEMFKITDENGTTHSPVELHWTLKQFISPIIGISKFIETGDYNHIVWGFGDALGSMPLVNAMFWNDAVTTSNALWAKANEAEAAIDKQGYDADIAAAAANLILNGVATFERQIFENSFINSVYVAADKYDRDPWTLQDIDADGNIQRDNLNQPMETNALNEYLDEQQNSQQGTAGREGLFGNLRSFSERRATLAFFGSMITGFDGQNTMWRYNMAPREYSIEKQAVDQDKAAAWILSEAVGDSEVLNLDGAEAFLKSIHAGYISGNSPVLENVYLTYEQRNAVAERFQTASYQNSYELGLTTEEADARWTALMYGTSDNPWATPLYDVIYSKNSHEGQIPYDATATYRQLNTTWVLGPDGKPWATGIARGELYNFFGQAPFNAYSGAGQGDPIGNLTIDGRLNATDAPGNINTGMRSLEKVNASTANPTDEDIIAALGKINESVKAAARTGNNGYNKYYGGGSSGGSGNYVNWSFMPFQNDMTQPYIDNVPGIYINNPNIRRGDIRRQRFSSDRGRLNQWQ